MITMQEFVEVVREAAGSHRSRVPPVFVEYSEGGKGPWVWTFSDVAVDPYVKQWLSESVYVALSHTDGSAQLLSRDEDECLLFQTLWELEK